MAKTSKEKVREHRERRRDNLVREVVWRPNTDWAKKLWDDFLKALGEYKG